MHQEDCEAYFALHLLPYLNNSISGLLTSDGEGGITLIKGPPGTGVSNTNIGISLVISSKMLSMTALTICCIILVVYLLLENDNADRHSQFSTHCKLRYAPRASSTFHYQSIRLKRNQFYLRFIFQRQYNKYYDEVRRIAGMKTGNRQGALDAARKSKPRLLVCAPSNAAVDNIILKIMEDGFVDGSGQRYNPSMIRVGVGQSSAVGSISLESKINEILSEVDLGQVESAIMGYKMELQRISADIVALRRRCHAIDEASPWPLGKDWEIRVDEATFDESGKCFFVNHKEQKTTYEIPPPPEPGETQFPGRSMPEYRAFMQRIVKAVESYFSVKSSLERNIIIKGSMENGANNFVLRQSLESHVLNSVHMVMTTLGTAGNRVFEGADRFEVVVVDEAAQSVEPATLSALQLGSRHCVLVGKKIEEGRVLR